MENTSNGSKFTYASFFSGAGIGCHGLTEAGLQCVLTNELLEERLEIQRANDKCENNNAYVCGDIRDEQVRKKIHDVLAAHISTRPLDLLLATPPCQGISLANHKKKPTEIVRNSLILESIKIVKEFLPNIFVFENVLNFFSTACSDTDGFDKEVQDVIKIYLAQSYNITMTTFNMKDVGVPSSRTRSVAIGTRKDLRLHPIAILPSPQRTTNLRETIGHLMPLTKPGAYDPSDPFHFSRPFDSEMLPWIENLKEGQSAFDQIEPFRRPHRYKGDERVPNAQKNGDKYRRQLWANVGPCIHTRSDTFSSQNTIHPAENRVFSIRELMLMMGITHDFRWTTKQKKIRTYNEVKPIELMIRKSIGEAVPPIFLRKLGKNIRKIEEFDSETITALVDFLLRKIGPSEFHLGQVEDDRHLLLSELVGKIILYHRLHKKGGAQRYITFSTQKSSRPGIRVTSTPEARSTPVFFQGGIYIYFESDSNNLSLF
jgi:DNA (cytosine-5)-methyltransferase 1